MWTLAAFNHIGMLIIQIFVWSSWILPNILDVVHMDNGFVLRSQDVSGKSIHTFALLSLFLLSFLACS